MTTAGNVFTRVGDRKFRYVQKHQDINTDFWYLDCDSGREFDVRDLPQPANVFHQDVIKGDRASHRKTIRFAVQKGKL